MDYVEEDSDDFSDEEDFLEDRPRRTGDARSNVRWNGGVKGGRQDRSGGRRSERGKRRSSAEELREEPPLAGESREERAARRAAAGGVISAPLNGQVMPSGSRDAPSPGRMQSLRSNSAKEPPLAAAGGRGAEVWRGDGEDDQSDSEGGEGEESDEEGKVRLSDL